MSYRAVRSVFIMLISGLMFSCSESKIKLDISGKKNAFIDITGYDYTPHLDSLYTLRKIIKLNCSTNLPEGTVIVFASGNGYVGLEKSKFNDQSDTLRVQSGSFSVHLAPAFLHGYTSFRIFESLQPDSVQLIIGTNGKNLSFKNPEKVKRDQEIYGCIFKTDYRITYKAEDTLTGTPSKPIELILKKL